MTSRNSWVGHERDGAAGADVAIRMLAHEGFLTPVAYGLADLVQRVVLGEVGVDGVALEGAGHAAAEGHGPRGAALVDLDVQARGQRVHDRRADAVQAARRVVRAAAELPAGVQLGVDDLDAGQAGLGLDVDGHAAAVVADLDGTVGVQQHLDVGAVPAERLVDGVVDDLDGQVVEGRFPLAAHIHTRTALDVLGILQDLDR